MDHRPEDPDCYCDDCRGPEPSCNCPDCPPGTPIRKHLANKGLLKEMATRERYKVVKQELKALSLLPPIDATFTAYHRTLKSNRENKISHNHLKLIKEYFVLRHKLLYRYFQTPSTSEEESPPEFSDTTTDSSSEEEDGLKPTPTPQDTGPAMSATT